MCQSEWNKRLSRGWPRKPGEGKRIQAFIPLGFTKTHPCYLFLLEEPRSASQIQIFSTAHSFTPQSSSQLWMVQLKGAHGHLTVKDQLVSKAFWPPDSQGPQTHVQIPTSQVSGMTWWICSFIKVEKVKSFLTLLFYWPDYDTAQGCGLCQRKISLLFNILHNVHPIQLVNRIMKC